MNIHWQFSNRHDGDMRNEENIKAFVKEEQYILAQQTHGVSVALVDVQDNQKKIPDVDGLVSSAAVTLVIRTADCVPILFYDATEGIIGAAHSGWKGTYGNIVKNTVEAMVELGALEKNIQVILGPHIHACCYSVDNERASLFLKKYGKQSLEIRHGVHFLNLKTLFCNSLSPYLNKTLR